MMIQMRYTLFLRRNMIQLIVMEGKEVRQNQGVGEYYKSSCF